MESWGLKKVIEEKEKKLFLAKIAPKTTLNEYTEVEQMEREVEMLKEIYWWLP